MKNTAIVNDHSSAEKRDISITNEKRNQTHCVSCVNAFTKLPFLEASVHTFNRNSSIKCHQTRNSDNINSLLLNLNLENHQYFMMEFTYIKTTNVSENIQIVLLTKNLLILFSNSFYFSYLNIIITLFFTE